MKATYIDHMGTDLSVVNAARVSFGKKSDWDWEVDKEEFPDYAGGLLAPLKEKDVKLINYLAKHDHWTPFGHTAITLHIKAPLFVARQLGKHQVGFVWNEISRRYVDDEPEFYVPEVWRGRSEDKKQGSDGVVSNIGINWDFSLIIYSELLDRGVAPEQARMVLPQSTYTEWYWTGNLYGYASMYKKRISPDTQWETQQIAKQIGEIIEPLFPVSWKALV